MTTKAVIFDMDDTLFLEKDYVLSGFNKISIFLEDEFNINSKDSYFFLENRFFTCGRENIFDHLLVKYAEELKSISTNNLIKEMVAVYRSHIPNILLDHTTTFILNKLKEKKIKTAIVTDGLPSMQKNKVYALGLNKIIDEIVYCWENNSAKPSAKCFKIAAKRMKVDIKDCLIVGDHPQKDIVPARILFAKAYRIHTGRFCDLDNDLIYPPHKSFNTLLEFFNEIIKYEN